jgi:hypothetical protein
MVSVGPLETWASPGRDRLAPLVHRAAHLADLGWARAGAHVGGELIDPGQGELGVAVGVELADGFLPACQAVATSPRV